MLDQVKILTKTGPLYYPPVSKASWEVANFIKKTHTHQFTVSNIFDSVSLSVYHVLCLCQKWISPNFCTILRWELTVPHLLSINKI